MCVNASEYVWLKTVNSFYIYKPEEILGEWQLDKSYFDFHYSNYLFKVAGN